MLHRTRDAGRYVDIGLDGLASLAHLKGIGDPARIDDRSGRPGRRPEQGGKLDNKVVALGRAETSTACDDDVGLGELRPFPLLGMRLHDGRLRRSWLG